MSYDHRTPIYDQISRKEVARIGKGKIFDSKSGNQIAATLGDRERFVFDDKNVMIGEIVNFPKGPPGAKIVVPIDYVPPMPEAFRKLLPRD
jgi:hypothetical protein